MTVLEPHEDFVVVTEGYAVSPGRQLSITMGRLDFEMNGVQEVAVYFDPGLKPDRLMMPESESPYYMSPSDPGADVALIPFLSKERRKLFECGFTHRLEGPTLILFLNYDEESAYFMIRELARLPKHASHDRPAELMALILGAIGRLRAWPIHELSHGWPVHRVELRVNHRFVSSIARDADFNLPAANEREDLLAAWEVGQ